MSDNEDNQEVVEELEESEQAVVDELLTDPRKKALLLQKLGVGDEENGVNTPSEKCNNTKEDRQQHLTLSGKSVGVADHEGRRGYNWPPGAPMWYPPPVPAFSYMPAGFGIRGHPIYLDGPGPSGCTDREPTANSGAGSGRKKDKGKRKRTEEQEAPESEEEELEGIDLLDEKEALEFVEFDPTVDTSGAWEAPKTDNIPGEVFQQSVVR